MYREIPNIEPLNNDVTIWRYMDLASFMNLILEKKLMFRRASSFKDYYDIFVDLDEKSMRSINEFLIEGEKSPNSFQVVHKVSSNEETYNYLMLAHPIQPIFQEDEICIRFDEKGQPISLADITYCSSWHENEHENYALWKIYLGNKPEGVAIKTSVKKIRDILRKNDSYDFYIGKVKYDSNKINIFEDKISNHDIILRKREEYEYENEIRIYTIDEKRILSTPCLYLPITNMEDLIEELWISPFAGGWVSEAIVSFLKKNNSLTYRINNSSIKER